MTGWTTTIAQAMKQSPFISGGLLMMVLTAMATQLRAIPAKLWELFLSQFTVEVEILNSDDSFTDIQMWLDCQPYAKKARRLSVRSIFSAGLETPIVIFTPAVGEHVFWFGKRLIWLVRKRDEPKGEGLGMISSRESIKIRVFGRDQGTIRGLLTEASKIARRRLDNPKVCVFHGGFWEYTGILGERSEASVVLPGETLSRLKADIQEFKDSREWYRERGVPWRRGYLFYGPPGTGKSSTVVALAGLFRMNVYALNLGALSSDDRLTTAMGGVPTGSVILFEDIDASTADRDETGDDGQVKKVGKVSLSTLLNSLDGVASKEGSIVIMTTNYPDRLDSALDRPGRIDYRVEFGYAQGGQIEGMFCRFFGLDEEKRAHEFARRCLGSRLTMAQVQQHCMTHRASARVALDRVGDLTHPQLVLEEMQDQKAV